jgi:hypothetical protein
MENGDLVEKEFQAAEGFSRRYKVLSGGTKPFSVVKGLCGGDKCRFENTARASKSSLR